jgi:hypothetical protein
MAGGTNGPPTLTLHGIKKMSAHFHFATLPKGQVVVTWYKLGKKRKRLTANNKAPRATIVAYLGPDTFAGTYQAVLTRKGVVVAKTSVKAFAS